MAQIAVALCINSVMLPLTSAEALPPCTTGPGGARPVDGVSGSAEFGRFSLYARGEYQHAPSAAGYSPALAATLSSSSLDNIPLASNPVQATLPQGPIPAANNFRIIEANVSYRLLNH